MPLSGRRSDGRPCGFARYDLLEYESRYPDCGAGAEEFVCSKVHTPASLTGSSGNRFFAYGFVYMSVTNVGMLIARIRIMANEYACDH